MIGIFKGRAPAVLRTRGKPARDSACAAHDASTADYADGTKKFEFDRSIYAAPSIKRALRRAQFDKCCFCEAKVTHVAAGDVEHFRPKAAYRQRPRAPLGRPGYFWLAYEWSNLLFCCEVCNRRGKANLFPLIDPSKRATPLGRDVSAEQPLFINPDVDDPAEHIEFRDEMARARNRSPQGRVTIQALQLNRKELLLRRREYLQLLGKLRETRELLAARHARMRAAGATPPRDERAHLRRLEHLFDELVSDPAEYAAMARAFLGRAAPRAPS